MRLILVRHGAVQIERPGTYYGGSEVPLSELGREEARRAADALRTLHLDHVVCSPLSRAHFGAQQISAGRGLADAPEIVPGLREIDRGRWLGLTAEEIDARWPQDRPSHQTDPVGWRGHSGESLADLRDRVLGSRDQLVPRWTGGTVALVAHLYPIRALLSETLGRGLSDWEQLRVPTGSISVLTQTSLGWVVEALGWKPEPSGEVMPGLSTGFSTGLSTRGR